MKNIILTLALFICYGVQSQIAIGTANPDESAILDLTSKGQGFLPPRLTTVERDAITNPAVGLTIFNSTKNCIEWYVGPKWYNSCGDNGVAIIDSYICDTRAVGQMTSGDRVSGVSQTITVVVSSPGSYNISATTNGVTFSAFGNFTASGTYEIVLDAVGIPTDAGRHEFALNTSAGSCSFFWDIISGQAVISSFVCQAGTGLMSVGLPVSDVTQTITANVEAIGNYNIRAFANGVAFSAVGTFTAIGFQDVVLTATGIPLVVGAFDYVIVGTPSCTFNRSAIFAVKGAAGKTWFAYNLGASAPASSQFDTVNYGDLYQWGRGTDGHEKRNSDFITTQATSNTPGHDKFIAAGNGHWRNPANFNLWQGVNGINNPCPDGFRLPTEAEWTSEIAASGIRNLATAYSSVLKLVPAGRRTITGGLATANGQYWSSTVKGNFVDVYTFRDTDVLLSTTVPVAGYSVRCITD